MGFTAVPFAENFCAHRCKVRVRHRDSRRYELGAKSGANHSANLSATGRVLSEIRGAAKLRPYS